MKLSVLALSAVIALSVSPVNAEVIEGRNDRVSLDKKLVSAIKRSVKSKGKCITVKANPGSISLLAFNRSVRKAEKNGVNPRTRITPAKITSRWDSGESLKRACVIPNGNGHHAAVMSNTKADWDKAAEELRKKLEALKNTA